MQKVYVKFEYEVNGNKVSFECNPNLPISDAKECAYLFLKELGQIEDSALKQQESKVENIEEHSEAKEG